MSGKHTIDELIQMVFELQESDRSNKREIASLRERISELERENAELRSKLSGGGKVTKTPEWVRANAPKREKKERKKRGK